MEQEKVWDAIAEKWAEFRTKPTEEVVNFLEGKGGRILDLGCGSGRHAICREGLEFYGIDFSEELLKFARKKCYVEVKRGYAWEVPYNDGFFDLVVFARVLHCVEGAEKRRKSLEEVYRVLKKDGEALISAWGKKGCKRMKTKEGFIPWEVEGEKVMRYTYVYDFEELKTELEEVGFEIVKGWESGCSCFVVRRG